MWNTCVAVACGARLSCSVFMVYKLLLFMALGARFHISAAPIVCIRLAGSLHI